MGKGLALTTKIKLAMAALALTLMGACGNDRTGPSPIVTAMGAMAKEGMAKVAPRKAAAKGGGKSVSPAERRAKLEEAGKPVLRVSSKTLGQNGFFSIVDAKGPVLTWAADGATFSQRGGVLIQTRGLGADLMSAEAPSPSQLMQAGIPYQRVYYFLGADDQGTRRTYDCTTAIAGRDSVEILGRSHATTHVTETCVRTNGKLTNDYWFEGAAIRKSRQWVSGGIGYIEFERVID